MRHEGITLGIGSGWKMTLTRSERDDMGSPGRPRDSIQAWCGFARTDAESITIYGDIEEGESIARAEVIFEPRFDNFGNGWQLKYPGRTFYDGCPASGMDQEAEKALFEVLPLEGILANILTLSLLVNPTLVPRTIGR